MKKEIMGSNAKLDEIIALYDQEYNGTDPVEDA